MTGASASDQGKRYVAADAERELPPALVAGEALGHVRPRGEHARKPKLTDLAYF